jgi:hypothetical protein
MILRVMSWPIGVPILTDEFDSQVLLVDDSKFFSPLAAKTSWTKAPGVIEWYLSVHLNLILYHKTSFCLQFQINNAVPIGCVNDLLGMAFQIIAGNFTPV